MLQQELEELKLSGGKRGLSAFVADYSPLRIQHETVQIPDALGPEVEPFLISLHLTLDDLEICLSRFLRLGLQLRHVASDLIEESPFEFEEIGIDA